MGKEHQKLKENEMPVWINTAMALMTLITVLTATAFGLRLGPRSRLYLIGLVWFALGIALGIVYCQSRLALLKHC